MTGAKCRRFELTDRLRDAKSKCEVQDLNLLDELLLYSQAPLPGS